MSAMIPPQALDDSPHSHCVRACVRACVRMHVVGTTFAILHQRGCVIPAARYAHYLLVLKDAFHLRRNHLINGCI